MSESEQALRRYVLARQEVASALQAGRQAAEAQGRSDAEEGYRELQARLAEDRFNLAVVGQFKRGKSSLMNAIIGRDLLPTGLLPLTSAITTLCYGPEARVRLQRKGWMLEQEITVGQLAEYVTERGNPGNEKGIIEARVELPVSFLRRGLHFVDTPGVGSAQAANTETTYAFLPQADAVIFVTSVEAPLSEVEDGFLRDIRQHVRRLFIVVNKMDLLADGERDEVLAYLRAGLARVLGAEPRLFPISAQQALAARLRSDDAGLATSGLVGLETELAAFLSLERGQTFLVSLLDRAVRLLDGASPPAVSHAETAAPADLHQQMAALRDRLLAGQLEPTRAAADNPPIVVASFDNRVSTTARAKTAARQPAAITAGGACPVCAAQTQALLDLFVETQYALGTAADAQQSFAQAHGFCQVHTWQFQPFTSPQGLSAGLGPLIETVLADLRRIIETPPAEIMPQVEARLSAPKVCAACRIAEEAQRAAVAHFLQEIETAEGRRRYAHSSGLCLRHLRAILARKPRQQTTSYLLRQQAQRLEEISEDMRSYVLKRAALRRGLTNSDEEGAWRRALVQLVGERNAYP